MRLYPTCLRPQRPAIPQGEARPHPRRTRVRSGIALVGAALALVLVPLCARAQSLHIYLYDAQGAPVEVTQSYLYQEHYVYDLAYNPIGSVDAQNVIHNASDQVIGYITSDSPAPGP